MMKANEDQKHGQCKNKEKPLTTTTVKSRKFIGPKAGMKNVKLLKCGTISMKGSKVSKVRKIVQFFKPLKNYCEEDIT